MSTLQDLQMRLARLNAAIHSGERTITTEDGASVTYRSLDEMMGARRDLHTQISAVAGTGQSRALVARFRFAGLRDR
ncbi:hypothetical protein Daci_4685 [Delftia acidovorans SPH-1]|uniref:GpW family protein n=2 Tax=Delftia acidovorans TaxID=80866 RepID=A9C3K3_DELAS|nr:MULTISPECIES: hypothetical protein [Delftia]MBA4004196.1 hypothetical protein [Delftia sp.]OLE94724.1 MAG: hypothetical protein AUI84_07905 [Delftia sp. 13_1_40CM_3_66_6]ABX37314.1 hypothetical protein Daci_4685 [Delftia acidovorans SPH-1]OLE07842.1 MAG: hypothetical protein AUG53_08025 [Delftia sp. 13_1_20CM_4_67_18]QPS73452.1 hypothetical protein I6G48_22770 [Delftia acidovorans]